MHAIAVSAPPDGLKRLQWRADGAVRIDLLGLVSFPPGHTGALHSHPFWELIFIGAGEGNLLREGVRKSCGREELILVPPGERHRFQAGETEILEQLYLGFSFDFGPAESAEAASRPLPPALAELLRTEFRACLDQLKGDGGPDAQAAARGRLLAVAGRVVAHLAAPNSAINEDAKGSLARTACEFLQSNLRAKVTVPSMARTFCLSPQYFGEVFKRETGLSVKEYQRNLRMDRALELLRSTSKSITAVAEEVGLEDLAYFSRLFKLRFGIPPRQARSGN